MTSFADLTTIGVGGPIATFLEPTTRVGVIEAVEEADSQGLPLCVIGGGSNMLVSDTPFEAWWSAMQDVPSACWMRRLRSRMMGVSST